MKATPELDNIAGKGYIPGKDRAHRQTAVTRPAGLQVCKKEFISSVRDRMSEDEGRGHSQISIRQ